MKTFLRVVSACVFVVFGAALLVSCGKGGPEYRKDVDVNAAIADLKSDDKDTRVNACVALSEAGPYAEAAIPALIESLEDPEPLVRSLSAYALGRMGEKAAAAIPALEACLQKPHRDVTPSVANAIVEIDMNAARRLGLLDQTPTPATQP